ncbi:MAG: tRNA uridine-5-carboxymethylaminomethyl(34) synthesis GTPase MnmE [Bacillota bacterium]|nr:tRNA uridine-5-carboxymethylaminomethyl(34) synthesis GTPase MnmE [Bacillota bacterium]MDD3298027.1 tRNA uridine-5-carboxymethylaminomethyl(34) synthesis GTPase MnmE [Bacillota bacterium]MDD3850058.1 tRNA uridine-5-carboxymethylaminomethyl(34) synthesis GTPase MnmE [Bacillota bacterium]MDD4706705.1 tRNA uridine-5-carboxymethylaminomethyl(34) synthesis GTPase MnmE [Bacillota bacterium]
MIIREGDTITAIATAPGESGIGIVRISGPEAKRIAARAFRAVSGKPLEELPGRRMNYGHIYNPDSGEIIDEVLVATMKAPHTYTREDVVEIHCHGGNAAVRKILEIIVDLGARVAEPGEFTKRAFINGRLDLSQAEAVMDIIHSKSEMGLKTAVSQLEGRLSRYLDEIKDKLLSVMAGVEASIDFPEHDIEEQTREVLLMDTRQAEDMVERLLSTSSGGRIVREGLKTAIIGKPNVGKSSLLNALLRENRAIVTEVPGTTRDVIEEYINLKGIPLRLMDTAGIRETDDLVESIGVEKTREYMENADLVLLMLDAARPLSQDDRKILDIIKDKRAIVLINKTDLEIKLNVEEITKKYHEWPVIHMSLIKDMGLDVLEDTIYNLVFSDGITSGDAVMVTRVRHADCLRRAKRSLEDAIKAMGNGLPIDLVSIDIKAALEALGEITGDNITEDIVDRIFEDFCIGK